jgi:hypothetical protein
MGRLAVVLQAAERAVVGFGNHLAAFVGKANPAAVQRFQLAVDDLQAVLGRALQPVLERVTQVVRTAADAFASLSPEAQKLAAGFGVGGVVGGFVTALAAVGPSLLKFLGGVKLVAGGLVGAVAGMALTSPAGAGLVAVFERLAVAFGRLAEILTAALVPVLDRVLVPVLDAVASGVLAFAETLGVLLDALGAGVGATRYQFKSGASVGASVQPATVSSFSAFSNRAYATAFQGSGPDVPRQQLEYLRRIEENTRGRPGTGGPARTASRIGRAAVEWGAAGALIGSVVPGVGTVAGGALGAGAGGLVQSLRELFG